MIDGGDISNFILCLFKHLPNFQTTDELVHDLHVCKHKVKFDVKHMILYVVSHHMRDKTIQKADTHTAASKCGCTK